MKVQGRGFDPVLTVIALAMTFIGCLVIFDAGFARSNSAIPVEFRNQMVWSVFSIGAGVVCALISARAWRKGAPAVTALGVLSLLAVMVFGHEMNGAQRWIKLGPIPIQPAEFMKVGVILFLAVVIANRKPFAAPKKKPKDWAQWMDRIGVPRIKRMWPLGVLAVAIVLIEREPDLGTAAVIAATAYAMFWYGGVSKKSIIWVTAISLLLVGGMIAQEPYRLKRILSHTSRWSEQHVDDIGYQTTQSETAMADGGVAGIGIGAGRVKHMMPAATTDFVFATVAEETGLMGTAVLLGTIGLMVWRLMLMAGRCQSRYGMMVCAGTAIWLTIQSCTNLMMANGLLPPIGIPFPFISSGGSSLLSVWIAIGICQSAAAEQVQEEEAAEARRHRGWNRRSRLSRA